MCVVVYDEVCICNLFENELERAALIWLRLAVMINNKRSCVVTKNYVYSKNRMSMMICVYDIVYVLVCIQLKTISK